MAVVLKHTRSAENEEAASHKPAVVFVDEKNQISRVTNYERHGLLKDMDT